MTYSWTYDAYVTIDGIDVTNALLSYSLSGNQTSAIVSGSLVFSKRALEAAVTVVSGMDAYVGRIYTVTEGEDTDTFMTVVFQGYVTAPTTEGQRTTVEVQDRFKKLLDTEVNKIYGTREQGVDIAEVAYDILKTAGLSVNYVTGLRAIQPTGLLTYGMVFAHTNAFEALKQLAASVDYQTYYDPRYNLAAFEPKGSRLTDTQTYVKGDFTGRPKWQTDVSNMCNKVGISTGQTTANSSVFYTQSSSVDMSTGAYITITHPREADLIVVGESVAGRRLNGSLDPSTSPPTRSMSEDFTWRVRDDGQTDVYIFQNTALGTDAYYDYPAGTVFTVSARYKAPYTYYYYDAESVSAYGEIKKTISRSDLQIGDNIEAVGEAYLQAHANPTESVTVDLVHDPYKFCYLGGAVSIVDTINDRTETDMTVIGFTLNHPKKTDSFTFGQHQPVFADYTAEMGRRIQQLETTTLNRDYTQVQYEPIGGFITPDDPDEDWTVSSSVSTVLASGTTTTNAVGNPMQWKTGYASGRYWVFWGDGTNDVYSTSVNGLTAWSAKTTLTTGIGNDLSMDFSSNGLHYIRGRDVADLKYRRAVLNSDGTITWNSEVSAGAGGSVNRIHQFSWDTNMNCVYSYMRDGSVYVNRMLKPITGYNGTWVTDSSTGSGGDFTMSFPTIAPAITITKSGSTYTATRVSDNSTVSSGTNAATVIQAALDGLTSGRTAKQKVYLNDSATISTMITMPSYSVLECADGVIITGGASNRIIGCTSAAHDIEIIGGEWVCGSTTASQTVAPMYFNTPTDLIVRSCKVRDCMYDNIIVTNGNHCTFYDVESFHSWPLDPMDIAANGWHGIIFQTTNGHNASYNTVQKCYFHDNGHGGCYFYTEPGWTSEISHNEMRGNRVEMCGTSGLSISQRSSAGQGHYNIIEYNFLKDCGLDNDHPFINIGYSSCYPDTTTHNIVRYNTLIDNNLAGPKSAEYGQYGADQGIICQGSSTEIYKNDIKGATGGITLLCGTGIDCHDNYIHEVASQGVNALYNSAIVIFSAVGSSSIKDNDVYDVDNVFCYYTSSCGAGPGSNTISGNNDLANPLTTFDGGYASGSSTSGGGFPMEVVDDADMDSHICRLSGDKFIVFYGKAGATVKARMFNGTTLGGEETCSLGPLASATAISTAHDNSDQVWMLYTKNTGTDYRIMYRHRSSGGSWDAEEQDVVGSAVYSSSVGWIGLGYDNQLYAMWFNYPNTNHIYYRPITKAGVMGDIVDAYTDADGIASVSRANLMPVARPTSSTTAAMGLAYIAGSSPYKVKLFKLNFNSGTTAVVEDPVEPETEGSAPITDYDYICYSDGRAGVKNGTLTDRGSARQGIQWCIDNCPAGGNILLSPGTYNIDGQITVKNNNIYGSVNYSTQTIWNGTTLQMESTPNVAVPACRLLATWNDGSGGSGTGVGYIFRRDSGYTEPITIGYLELDGGMDYNAANSRAVYGGIGLYRSTNTTVTNCYIHNFCKAGVYIADTTTQTGSTYNGRIQNCEIAYIGMRWTSGATRWWGNGIAWGGGGYSTGASRNYVSNCYIHDCTMHAADFEPGKNSTIINCRMDCSTSYTDTGSNTKAPWTVGYLAWGGRSSTGNLLSHCLIRSETGWTVVYNGSTTTGNTATNNTCQYHSGGAGFVASGDASLGNQTFSGNTETAI